MEDIVLVGGGGHCRSCIDVLEQLGGYTIAGIVDVPEKQGQKILGYSIFAGDDQLDQLAKQYRNFLVTVGQLKTCTPRRRLFLSIQALGGNLPTIISPLAYVSAHAEVGAGTIVMHHAILNAGAHVGANCIINSRALIEHDVQIGDHSHVATGAVANGGAVLGGESFLGSCAVIRQGCVIGRGGVVGMNATVKRNVLPGETFV